MGARARRASSSCRTSPASARRTPIRTRAGAFVGLSLRHDRGALVRAVLEGVAYGLRDSLELLRELGVDGPRSAASPAAARAASSGSDRRLGARPPARADRRRGGRRLRRGAARRRRARASSPTPARRSARCVRVPRSDRARARLARRLRASGYARFRALYPALRPLEDAHDALEGKVAVITGASRGIGAAVARALATSGVKLGLASRSGDDLGLDGVGRAAAATCATATQLDGARRRDGRALRRHRHRRRERRRRRVRPVPRPLARAPRRDDRRQPQGHDLRGTRGAAAPARERRGRHRHARLRGGAARAAVRGRLLRVEVRAGRLHARARPRAARAAASAARTSAPAASRPTSRSSEGRGRTPDVLRGDDDAPRTWPRWSCSCSRGRATTASSRPRLRPMTETSWG